MTTGSPQLRSHQLPLDRRLEQQEKEDESIVASLLAMDQSEHDCAQGYKLLIARRLYQLSREGVFPTTQVRRTKNKVMIEETGTIIRLGAFEAGSNNWVFLDSDGAMQTGDAYTTEAALPDSPGIDLRSTQRLSDAEYIKWGPAALAAIRDAVRQHVATLQRSGGRPSPR